MYKIMPPEAFFNPHAEVSQSVTSWKPMSEENINPPLSCLKLICSAGSAGLKIPVACKNVTLFQPICGHGKKGLLVHLVLGK